MLRVMQAFEYPLCVIFSKFILEILVTLTVMPICKYEALLGIVLMNSWPCNLLTASSFSFVWSGLLFEGASFSTWDRR